MYSLLVAGAVSTLFATLGSAQFAIRNSSQGLQPDSDDVYIVAPNPSWKDTYRLKDLSSSSLAGLPNAPNNASGRPGSFLYLTGGTPRWPDYSQKIVLIGCDPMEGWNENNTMADAVQSVLDARNNTDSADAAGIVFFTREPDVYCIINVDPVPDYEFFFSVWDSNTAEALLHNITTSSYHAEENASYLIGEIITGQALKTLQATSGDFNAANKSTALAMIILYSVTGIVTALFLLIIMAGAIRAHRNPERYLWTTTSGWRRPTQRARGIARAILDTLPIVKYDDGKEKPAAHLGDVELAQSSRETTPEADDMIAKSAAQATHVEVAPVITNTPTPIVTSADAAMSVPLDVIMEEKGKQRISSQIGGAQETDSAIVDSAAPGCSICTEDFENGQDVRVLPCEHKFHPACVDPWLLDVSSTCPLCRIDLRPESEREESENQDGLPPPLDPEAPTNLQSLRRRDIFLTVMRQGQTVNGRAVFPAPRRLSESRRRAGALRRLYAEREVLRERVRNERDPAHPSYTGAEPNSEAQRRAALLSALEQLPDVSGESDGNRWARLRSRLFRRPINSPAVELLTPPTVSVRSASPPTAGARSPPPSSRSPPS